MAECHTMARVFGFVCMQTKVDTATQQDMLNNAIVDVLLLKQLLDR